MASSSASARSSRDVDRGVGAELERQCALVLAGGGRDHASRAEGPRQLNRERADPARGRVDDDRFPGGEVRRRAVEMPGGQPLHQQRQRDRVGDAVGDREHVGRRHGGELGVAAGPAGQRHHPRAVALERARDLGPGDERQVVALHVLVAARVRVGEVHSRARDAHEQLAVGGLGHRSVLDELEHLRTAPLGDPDGAHRPQATLAAP